MQLFSEKDHGMKAYPDRHLFAFKCWFYDVVLVVRKSDFYLEDDWSTPIVVCFTDSSKDHVHRCGHYEIALQGLLK